MAQLSKKSEEGNTLIVRLGSWFEARASGWGVVALVTLLLLLGLLQVILS